MTMTTATAARPKWLRSDIVLGLWPIAGVTTMNVTDDDAHATIDAALDAGIRTFDTAFSYGLTGQSDRFLRAAMARHAATMDRSDIAVIGKVGQRYDDVGTRYVDARPETLTADVHTSLRRSGLEKFDLLMLHSVDERVPITDSAAALEQIRRRGLADAIGLCNATTTQRHEFETACRCEAIQCPLNLLQRDALADPIAPAAVDGVAVLTYWALMKGLLAGKIGRTHLFVPGDSRPGYAIFQGQARERAHVIVDRMRELGDAHGRTVAEIAVSWVLSQPGVTAALVGARRGEQVRDFAAAAPLDPDVLAAINSWTISSGPPAG